VFALKAALLPLSFWLPMSYAAAGAPVAALFAIMTKVGIVALLRVQVVAFAPAAATADLLAGWLTPLALATVLFAALGALAAGRLRALAAWLVLGSAGALLAVPALAGVDLTAAALYYLAQSTLAGAAFFLLAEHIAERRGDASDAFRPGPAPAAPWLALGFFVAAVTAAGLPPFSGFIGKLMLLEAFRETPAATTVWTVLLLAGFLVMASLARNGSRLFWDRKTAPAGAPQGEEGAPPPAGWRRATAIALLVAAGPLLALFARPVADYAARAAAQLHAPEAYIAAVLGKDTRSIWRQRRP
jgi:multicomponent K+:H+ antiporter subunit D